MTQSKDDKTRCCVCGCRKPLHKVIFQQDEPNTYRPMCIVCTTAEIRDLDRGAWIKIGKPTIGEWSMAGERFKCPQCGDDWEQGKADPLWSYAPAASPEEKPSAWHNCPKLETEDPEDYKACLVQAELCEPMPPGEGPVNDAAPTR
jgi:hypothetical protein